MQLNEYTHELLGANEFHKWWDVDLSRTPMEFWMSDIYPNNLWNPFVKSKEPATVEKSWWRIANFEMDGDQMVWCFPGDREPTPEEAREGKVLIKVFPREGEKLSTAPGDRRLLVHFERQKDPGAEKQTAEAAKSRRIPQRRQPKTVPTERPRPTKERISPAGPK